MKFKFLLTTIGLFCLQSQMATAQTISATTTIFNNGQGNGGDAPGFVANIDLQALSIVGDIETVPIGPAPLVDYELFSQVPSGVIPPAFAGDANIIGATTTVEENTNTAIVDEFSAVQMDGTPLATASFGIQSSNLSGSVDLTGFSNGTVYLIYGSFIDVTQATATLGGASAAGDAIAFTPPNANQIPDVDPEPLLDIGLVTVFGTGSSGSIVTAFDFDTAGGAFTDFQFNLLNADADGSRARVAGIVVVANQGDVPADCLLGDLNGDTVVDFLDISPFISALTSGQFQCEADINQDSVVDFLDISPFIGILSSVQ